MNTTLWFVELLPLAGLVLVMSITPGPNNVLVLDSGIRFGVRRTLPHLFGITAGFVLLLLLVFAGMGQLIERLPWFLSALTVACSGYLLWIAWVMVGSKAGPGTCSSAESSGRPWSLSAAAGFQFLNPKGWAMAITCAGLAAKLSGGVFRQAALLCVIAAVLNFPCVLVWATFGAAARRSLESPDGFRLFNWSMAMALLVTVIVMLEDVL